MFTAEVWFEGKLVHLCELENRALDEGLPTSPAGFSVTIWF